MLGERLIRLRKAKKFTQTDLAELCGVSRNSIVNWETDKREPKISDIQKLAEVLDVSPNDLIGAESHIQHTQHVKSASQGEQDITDFAYWGGIVNNVRKLLVRGDEREILSITPLIKLAYEMLTQKTSLRETVVAQMPVSGGHHNRNTQNVRVARA